MQIFHNASNMFLFKIPDINLGLNFAFQGGPMFFIISMGEHYFWLKGRVTVSFWIYNVGEWIVHVWYVKREWATTPVYSFETLACLWKQSIFHTSIYHEFSRNKYCILKGNKLVTLLKVTISEIKILPKETPHELLYLIIVIQIGLLTSSFKFCYFESKWLYKRGKISCSLK